MSSTGTNDDEQTGHAEAGTRGAGPIDSADDKRPDRLGLPPRESCETQSMISGSFFSRAEDDDALPLSEARRGDDRRLTTELPAEQNNPSPIELGMDRILSMDWEDACTVDDDWLREPWAWLSEEDDADTDTREYLRSFCSEVKESYSVPKIRSRDIDQELLSFVGDGLPEAVAATLQPKLAVLREQFKRQREVHPPSSAAAFGSLTMAGHAGRSLRRASSLTSRPP